jgi:hypothetical protein
VTPQGRDKVLREADKMVQTVGGNSIEEAVELACRGFEKLLTILNMMRTRERAIETLDRLEATPAEEKFLVFSIKAIPMLVRFGAKKLAAQTQQDLPAPPTGRPPELTAEQQVKIINLISELNRIGTDLGSCKCRAQQRFGVSFRTVERVWNERGEILKSGPEPHFYDVVRTFTE